MCKRLSCPSGCGSFPASFGLGGITLPDEPRGPRRIEPRYHLMGTSFRFDVSRPRTWKYRDASLQSVHERLTEKNFPNALFTIYTFRRAYGTRHSQARTEFPVPCVRNSWVIRILRRPGFMFARPACRRPKPRRSFKLLSRQQMANLSFWGLPITISETCG